jgi:hypothetical protein
MVNAKSALLILPPMTTSVNRGRHVYHRVPPDLRGTTLYPLNQLEGHFPDLYARLSQNYATRRDIAALRIPRLGNCLWNDVIHLSPVHPARIQAALAEAGHELPATWHSFYQIDARLLDPETTVLYQMTEVFWSGHFDIGEASARIGAECLPFSPELLDTVAEVPDLAREYYASVPPGGPLALFLGIPHVLYRGQLDTRPDGISIVEV